MVRSTLCCMPALPAWVGQIPQQADLWKRIQQRLQTWCLYIIPSESAQQNEKRPEQAVRATQIRSACAQPVQVQDAQKPACRSLNLIETAPGSGQSLQASA